MKILSLDLELNQAPTGAKIIEIGACVGETTTGEILAEYAAFVNPNEILEDTIIKLTGIQQTDIDNGSTIEVAYLGMESMAKSFDANHMPLVWGMGDGHAIRKELPPDVPWGFGRRELDVKALFQAYQIVKGEKVHAGLSKAMTKLGLSFKGKKHRALDDAKNTFIIFYELLQRFKI